MKFENAPHGGRGGEVAPHWGAWIEIADNRPACRTVSVAPHWGAWIEISVRSAESSWAWSHPTGVRGLKYHLLYRATVRVSRTPLGCVD